MIRTQPLKSVFAFAAVASILLLAGCHKDQAVHSSGKLTRDNFAKIHKDMTGADIEAILGAGDVRRPTTTDASGVTVPAEEYDWTEGDTWISVIFVGGQAVSWDSHGLP